MTQTKTGRPKREHPSDEEPSSPPFRKRRAKIEMEDKPETTDIFTQYKVETDSECDESGEEDDDECTENIVPQRSRQEKLIEAKNLKELESITKIIKFMDEIEPDKKYYKRQEDTDNECSKVRAKLRKFAEKKENENNDAVVFYVETKRWRPRDKNELRAIMELLKTMIDKSWPTLALGK